MKHREARWRGVGPPHGYMLIAVSIPDVGLLGGLPWKEATLARIPEKQTENWCIIQCSLEIAATDLYIHSINNTLQCLIMRCQSLEISD